MKGCVQWNPVMVRKIFHLHWEPRTTRSDSKLTLNLMRYQGPYLTGNSNALTMIRGQLTSSPQEDLSTYRIAQLTEPCPSNKKIKWKTLTVC